MEQTITQNENMEPQAATVSQKPVKKKHILLILIVAIMATSAISVVATVYVLTSKQPEKIVAKETPPAEINNNENGLFTGRLTKLDKDLQIFKKYENEDQMGEGQTVYYSAGKFNKGALKGYDRIIAIKESMGPGEPYVYTLATKDYTAYILDDPQKETAKYADTHYSSPYFVLDKNKISEVQTFDTYLPQVIKLNDQFALYEDKYPTVSVPTQNQEGYTPELLSDMVRKKELTAPDNFVKMYFTEDKVDPKDMENMDDIYKQERLLRESYLLGRTVVSVVDPTGLTRDYHITTNEAAEKYVQERDMYEQKLAQYEKDSADYRQGKLAVEPVYPEWVAEPTLGFKSEEITTTKTVAMFKTYETLMPGACAMDRDTYVVNIADSDVEQIGTLRGAPIYTLKEIAHPLYKMAFDGKLGYYQSENGMSEEWDYMNAGMSKPNFDEYAQKHPILFTKDFWGRWIGFGEYDIKMPGGCGKPVIYLYPQKETEVSLQFLAPVQFTTEIPAYKGEWKVLAKPNGTLTDLRQNTKDCSRYNSTHIGSEYAQEACLSNNYPYIYWAGNIISKEMPTNSEGWVVAKDNLRPFLEKTLLGIGLSTQEVTDFTEYWVPELARREAKYFKISFVQTKELNEIFPMNVVPTPDTVFRIFMNYDELQAKPLVEPKPQKLEKLTRNGFTMVGWGGRK